MAGSCPTPARLTAVEAGRPTEHERGSARVFPFSLQLCQASLQLQPYLALLLGARTFLLGARTLLLEQHLAMLGALPYPLSM